ncbi:hypothetical protein [Ruminiclostridium cellobioparum]|uniref:Uncharacterized protein n=1 Tax=Ruminiclostridium cellobioparum subsp. termitidis CT1112 TaxID=1195236 RepID=S0FQ87_RUMCE|nr:hypothetical protein [Ruminiclostridium cellobioparum]EMS74027.1 hypothetical protein CTER_5123 [Ruminiclostridium cellobioparum subsp. termitidis CT1112]
MKSINLDISQLILNKKYKYSELCFILNDKERSRGNSRNSQFKNWKRYFYWELQGHSFIITKVFTEPKEKIDKRGGNHNIYSSYIDKLLKQYLYMCGSTPTYATSNKLAYIFGMVNKNYCITEDNKQKFLSLCHYNVQDTNETAMYDVLYIIKETIKSSLKSSLERLEKHKLITYSSIYMMAFCNEHRPANQDENEMIQQVEIDILKEIGVRKKSELFYNDTLRHEYYTKVQGVVKENVEKLNYIYQAYEINFDKDKLANISKSSSILMKQLNNIIIETTYKKLEARQEEARKKAENLIGKPPPRMGKVINRIANNYLSFGKYVIDLLININSVDIKQQILNITSINNKKIKKIEMYSEFISNQNEEDQEMWQSIFENELTF